MDHEGQVILIKDALVFLFAAGMIVPVLRAFRLPTVAGFILAGVALGPNGIGALAHNFPALALISISEPAAAGPFAELGVLFLLFLLGLELSLEKLWGLRRVVFGAGLVQAGLSTVLIATIAILFGMPPVAAVLVGLALALSSTAIVMQLLIDSKNAGSPVGRTALGVLLLQDILVAPILIFAGFAGRNGGDLGSELGKAALEGFVAIAVIYLIGRFLLRPLFRLAVGAGGRDFLMAITLLTIVGAAMITGGAGLSIALGAFLAGLLLGESEFKHQIEVDLDPFKGLLLGLFFMTVGFGLDIGAIFEQWPLVLICVAVLLVIKVAAAAVAIRLAVGNTQVAIESAFLLAPAGEFAFVILSAASLGGALTPAQITLVGAIAGVSMLLTPLMWRIGKHLGALRKDAGEHIDVDADFSTLEGHIIVAGFGRVGRALANILERQQAEIVALDQNGEIVAREKSRGLNIYMGDGSRPEVLQKVGLTGARMLVVTLDDPESAQRTVRAARNKTSTLPILARAQDADHSRELYEAGATFVVPDAIEAGLQMSARALEEIGYTAETVQALIAAERDAAYRKATEKA